MDIAKICAVGIISALCVLILKDTKSEAAMLVGIAGGCIILLMLIDYISDIFSVIKSISEKAGIPASIWTMILKIVGVGYIAEFSAGIVEDTGSKALAEKIILGGKIIIIVLSLPIVIALFELVANMFN